MDSARDPRHRLDGLEHVIGVRDTGRLHARAVEECAKPPEPLELGIHASQLGPQDVAQRRALVVEHLTDVRERQAQVAQGADTVQAPHVALGVESLVPLRPLRGREQPNVLVVVECAHRQPGGLRQLADSPVPTARLSFLHARARYNLTSRQVQGRPFAVRRRNKHQRPSRTQGALPGRVPFKKRHGWPALRRSWHTRCIGVVATTVPLS